MANGKTKRNGMRDERGLFKKGNPGGGRPKGFPEFQKKCQEFMEAEGWELLCNMARGPSRNQSPALELIAGYAYGRPKQGVDISGGLALSIVKRAWDENKPTT